MFTALAYLIIILGSISLVRITVFLVGSDIYSVQQTLRKKYRKQLFVPYFTVVVPAHNEENTIRNNLQSLIASNYPRERLQVVVVDDGSVDQTVSIVEQIIQENPKTHIELISQPNAGKAHALNRAIIQHATGELVMCLDADSSILPDAIINAAQYFTDKRVVALSSNVKIRPTKTFLNLIQRYEYLVCYQMKRAQTVFNIEYIIGGIGSTFRRSALKKVGYYDTDTITEDIDLTFKLIRCGNRNNRVIYGSNVIAYTESVLTIKDLIRQRFRWKHGRSQTFLKNLPLFFSFDKCHNKLLTWLYLPYALVADVTFFLEPLVIGFILYIVIAFGDWSTIVGAFAVNGLYVFFNVIAEDTIPLREKIKLAIMAPSMYFFFYILSFIEYVALIKSYLRAKELIKKTNNNCHWEHVERASLTQQENTPQKPNTMSL